MKNSMNITLGNINLVIDGQPVQLENINLEYTNEASVQELATSTSFIKDMVNEVKSMIKDAQASAAQYTPAPTTSTTSKTTDKNKVATAPKKLNQCWDLPAVWSCMMTKRPEGFKKTGIGSYTFETTEDKVKNKITVHIEFNENSIDMDIYTGSTAIHGYLYSKGERSRISGINPALMNDMIEEMPEEIKKFVKDYFDKIINK